MKMYMRFFLLLICCCWINRLHAQESAYEQQRVVLASGEEELLWISLNEQSDQLRYKSNEADKSEIYNPAAVTSFRYGGQNYYSLPLRDGYITFFKVYHEGKEFAVLDKAPNYKILRTIAEDSEGEYSVCQNKRNDEFYLCNKTSNLVSRRAVITVNPGPVPVPRTRQFQVRQLTYLAIEGKLKLFYIDTDQKSFLAFEIEKPKPGKRKVENMFEDFIEDEDKIRLIQKRVKEQKLDIRKPEDLVKALAAAYR